MIYNAVDSTCMSLAKLIFRDVITFHTEQSECHKVNATRQEYLVPSKSTKYKYLDKIIPFCFFDLFCFHFTPNPNLLKPFLWKTVIFCCCIVSIDQHFSNFFQMKTMFISQSILPARGLPCLIFKIWYYQPCCVYSYAGLSWGRFD